MKHNSICILIFLVCFSCCTVRSQGISYDCRLHEGDFSALEYVQGSLIESSFSEFTGNIDNGVFFIHRYLGQDNFSKAILLREESGEAVVADLLSKKEVVLSNEQQMKVGETLNNIEKGAFRQACFKGASEGSVSVLVVKVGGATVLKYEAAQHDYSHLNESERVKIKNALELIKLLVST